MSTNGQRRPPRPRISISPVSATPEEAVAIATALEQFLVDTAPVPLPAPPASGWQRRAMLDAVGLEEEPDSWGAPLFG